MASQSIEKPKPSRLSAFALGAVLVLAVPPLAFVLTVVINDLFLPFPSGEYKEILNITEMSDRRLFDDTASCFWRNWLPHRVVNEDSIQVQSSVLRKSVKKCWNELNVAKWSTGHPNQEWTRTYTFWRGR